MHNRFSQKLVSILSLIFAIAGFCIQFWPLELLAVLTAGLGGSPVVALVLGVLFDLIYGVPVGQLHYLFFPFTLAALVGIGVYMIASRFMLERYSSEWL